MWNKKFQKGHLFIDYKFTNPFLATLRLGHPGSQIRLWICKFVNNKQMAFLKFFVSQQLLFFIFKTSGYNVECDRLWDQSNRSLQKGHHRSQLQCRPNFTKCYHPSRSKIDKTHFGGSYRIHVGLDTICCIMFVGNVITTDKHSVK